MVSLKRRAARRCSMMSPACQARHWEIKARPVWMSKNGCVAPTLMAFLNAINVGATQPFFDIQTGLAFISQWRAWQAGDIIEHRRAARRLSDTIREIFGYDSLEVNAANNNETLELFIEGESYMLPELGSGIAQFFMVL